MWYSRAMRSKNNLDLSSQLMKRALRPTTRGQAMAGAKTPLNSDSAFEEGGFAKTIQGISDHVRELYLCDAIPWVIGYSGGKDSSAVLQLVWNAIRELPEDKR